LLISNFQRPQGARPPTARGDLGGLEDYDYLSTSDLAGKKIRQNRKRVHVWTLADL